MEHIVEAQVIDSHHLRLKNPIRMAPGSTVMVTIETGECVAEEREWYLLSALGLEKAYGESEPDYPESSIKTPNPEYRP